MIREPKISFRLGALHVQQVPAINTLEISIVTTWSTDGVDLQYASSRMPFEEAERLNDNEFRRDLARRHIVGRTERLRALVAATDAALAAPLDPEKPSPTDAHHIGKRFDSGAK